MIVEADARVAASLEAVFDALTDAAVVIESLPGTRLRPKAPPGTVAADLQVSLGDHHVTYRGALTPTELDRDAGAVAFLVKGRELRTKGVVEGTVAMRLRSATGSTTLSVRCELELGGRAADAGDAAVGAAVSRLVDDLAAGLGRHLEGTTAAAAGSGVDEVPAAPLPAAARMEASRRLSDDVSSYPWFEPPASATAAPAPFAAPRIEVSPPQAPPQRPSPARVVRGIVRLVTDEPLRAEDLPVGDGPLARLRALDRRRPWAIPAALAVALTLLLLVVASRSRRKR